MRVLDFRSRWTCFLNKQSLFKIFYYISHCLIAFLLVCHCIIFIQCSCRFAPFTVARFCFVLYEIATYTYCRKNVWAIDIVRHVLHILLYTFVISSVLHLTRKKTWRLEFFSTVDIVLCEFISVLQFVPGICLSRIRRPFLAISSLPFLEVLSRWWCCFARSLCF